jgi:hypothetical protein
MYPMVLLWYTDYTHFTHYTHRAIATVVLQGRSEVRVGGVSFTVGVGDMYMLSGAARDDVDHEVRSSHEDRIGVTIRYGSKQAQE